jgi:hypothetical protein
MVLSKTAPMDRMWTLFVFQVQDLHPGEHIKSAAFVAHPSFGSSSLYFSCRGFLNILVSFATLRVYILKFPHPFCAVEEGQISNLRERVTGEYV